MPGYKAHLAGGLAVSVPMLYLLRHQAGSPGVAALWIGFALAGSLFPDIDTTSKGQKWFFRFWLVILLLLLFFKKYALFIASALLATAPLIVNHRGLFHKSWFLILIPCFTATVFAFCCGYTFSFVSRLWSEKNVSLNVFIFWQSKKFKCIFCCFFLDSLEITF